MPELRWILTAIGIALIIGVYIWSRRGRTNGASSRREPGFGERTDAWRKSARSEEQSLDVELGPEFAVTADKEDPHALDAPELPPEGNDLIIALRLPARRQEGFDGAELIKVFSAEGLEYGRFGAFHSLDERRRSRFMVASLVEPGNFEIEKMHALRCPGISMFMVLPGPPDPLSALDAMFNCARRLADRLDAEVLDETGNALTMQQTGWLRERVVEFQRRRKLGAEARSGGSGDPV